MLLSVVTFVAWDIFLNVRSTTRGTEVFLKPTNKHIAPYFMLYNHRQIHTNAHMNVYQTKLISMHLDTKIMNIFVNDNFRMWVLIY